MPTAAPRRRSSGYGLAGRVFHAPLVAAEPDMEVAAIVTGDPARRAAAAADHPRARLLRRGRRALGRPGSGRPGGRRRPATAPTCRWPAPRSPPACPSWSTSPSRPTAPRARALVDEAERGRRDADRLPEPPLGRRPPHAPAPAGRGRGGRRRCASSRASTAGGPQVNAAAWRERPDPEDAGGLLADLGSHLIDQAILLFGPPVEVRARARPPAARRAGRRRRLRRAHPRRRGAQPPRGHDARRAPGPRMRLRRPPGARGRSTGSTARRTRCGTGRAPATPGSARCRRTAWGALSDGDATAPGAERARRLRRPSTPGVARALRDGAPPPVDPAEAVLVLEVIDAARADTQRA